MGASGVDILLSQHAMERFRYSVECKSRASMAIYSLWRDTTDNVAPDTHPLLVIKQNRSDPLVVVTLEHFMELAKNATKT